MTDVRFVRANGTEIGLLEGGETVAVIVKICAEGELHQPIIGFHAKDRLGQALFGDNTRLAYRERDIHILSGDTQARFVFNLTLLRSGDYAITVAMATRTLEGHAMRHWVHDAILFKAGRPC